jgi:MerR family transcriptional regulator, light-induced transcriptional regulator
MSELQHSIRTVARRTGLSPHVIRSWEKRYGTITPGRTQGNQRAYSSSDVERLLLLKRATEAGHSISGVARLSTEKLSELVAQEYRVGSHATTFSLLGNGTDSPAETNGRKPVSAGQPSTGKPADEFLRAALAAVDRMNPMELQAVLDRSSVELGHMPLLNRVVVPLVEQIGEMWAQGNFKVAHEHIATAVLRTFLGELARPMAVHAHAPVLLATTPAGQLHELGAILAAAVASSNGWRVVYAGPSLPSEEIASAAIHNKARAVALSIVHPADDPTIGEQLTRLRRLLPANMSILIGGRSSSAYASDVKAINAIAVTSLESLATELNRLRTRTS